MNLDYAPKKAVRLSHAEMEAIAAVKNTKKGTPISVFRQELKAARAKQKRLIAA